MKKSELKRQIKSLYETIEKHIANYISITNENGMQKNKIVELKNLNSTQEQTIKDLTKELQEAKLSLNDGSTNNVSNTVTYLRLEAHYENTKVQNEIIEREKQALAKENEQLKAEVNKWKDEAKKYISYNKEVSEENYRLKLQYANKDGLHTEEVNRMQKTIDDIVKANDDLNKSRNGLKNKLDAISGIL